jgi:hypothetical protein
MKRASSPVYQPTSLQGEVSVVVVYRAFDELVDRIIAWMTKVARGVSRYDEVAVAKRTVQRIVEITVGPFANDGLRRQLPGSETAPSEAGVRRCGGLVIDATGVVRPGIRLLVRSLGRFSLDWCRVLGLHLTGVVRRVLWPRQRTVLLLGMGAFIDGCRDDARFAAYCRGGPIHPLRDATRIIVEARCCPVSERPDVFVYATNPLLTLAQRSHASLVETVRFLVEHFRALASFLIAVCRVPVVCLLARDFAYHAMVWSLNRRRLIEAFVMTHSTQLGQPLWMTDLPARHYTTHMIWYSTNSSPLVYAGDNAPGGARAVRPAIPWIRHVRVDTSWVWTETYADYLRKLGVPGNMRAIGPILWCLPEAPRIHRNDAEIRLAVFDVTPVLQEMEQRLGLIQHYYRTDTMIHFIEDIVAAARALEEQIGKRASIALKPKRAYEPIHDSRYIAFVERLSRSAFEFEVLPPETNMFSLVSRSDVTVVIPYSSPAYVASHLGRPAVYYDPTGRLVPCYEEDEWISFASGRENLVKTLRTALEGVGRSRVTRLSKNFLLGHGA